MNPAIIIALKYNLNKFGMVFLIYYQICILFQIILSDEVKCRRINIRVYNKYLARAIRCLTLSLFKYKQYLNND